MINWPDDKDPDEVLPYSLDWRPRLGDATLLVASWWEIPLELNPDMSLQQFASEFTPTHSTVWLRYGTEGMRYTLLNRVQTDTGWTMDQSIRLRVRSK